MRIKDGKGKKTELVFLITAGVLTLALIVYLVWLVQVLVAKSDEVFTVSARNPKIPVFNFEKYEKIVAPLIGDAPTASSTASSSKL